MPSLPADSFQSTVRQNVERPIISEAGAADIDALLSAKVRDGSVPAVVAIVATPNQVLYHGAFGKRNVAEDIEVSRDSIFSMRSLTKPVTSVAVMMLAEAGEFDLDDPVSCYLTELGSREVIVKLKTDGSYVTEPAQSEITIRQLLTHTSGLAYGWANRTVSRLQKTTGKDPVDLPLLYQPGTRWTYSMSTFVLGNLVSKTSGVRLEEFIRTRILEPLELTDTFYVVPPEKRARVVTLHRRRGGVLVEGPNPEVLGPSVRGDTGLLSTAADYMGFLQMFLRKGERQGIRLLEAESVDAMIRNQIGSIVVERQIATDAEKSKDFPVGAGRDKFGLGFQISATAHAATPDLRTRGSYSWSGLYNTHFWVDPKRGIAGLILMQLLPFYDDAAMAAYRSFEESVNRNLTFRRAQ